MKVSTIFWTFSALMFSFLIFLSDLGDVSHQPARPSSFEVPRMGIPTLPLLLPGRLLETRR